MSRFELELELEFERARIPRRTVDRMRAHTPPGLVQHRLDLMQNVKVDEVGLCNMWCMVHATLL